MCISYRHDADARYTPTHKNNWKEDTRGKRDAPTKLLNRIVDHQNEQRVKNAMAAEKAGDSLKNNTQETKKSRTTLCNILNCDGDAKHCKTALKLVASFCDKSECDSESPLKISGIISLAGEEQTQVTSEDSQVKQEISSPPHTQIETHLVICKEEQNLDSVPNEERKEYFEVEKRDQDHCDKKAKKQLEFDQKLAVHQLKHCYVCEVLFDSRLEFVEHCKKMHGVTAGRFSKGKTTMRDFQKDNIETISRTKKLKYTNKMLDNKDQNNNKKRNFILKNEDDNERDKEKS